MFDMFSAPSIFHQKDAYNTDCKQNACMPCCNGLVRNQLRETEERLSELVDVVVDGLHVGFARSIQNYSHILQLFKESKEQVNKVHQQLGAGLDADMKLWLPTHPSYSSCNAVCHAVSRVKPVEFFQTYKTRCWPRIGLSPCFVCTGSPP